MVYTSEQDAFIATHHYCEIEARPDLFAELTYRDYRKRRQQLRLLGVELPNFKYERFVPAVAFPLSPPPDDIGRVWDQVIQFQQTINALSRPLTETTITLSTHLPIGIVFMSDWHIGGMGTDHAALLRDIDIINSCDRLFVYVGGDPTDNFIPEKLAAAARDEQIINPELQWRMFRHAIESLLPSLIAVGRGNHDAWTSRLAGIEGIDQALRGIPMLHTAEDTYLTIRVQEQSYLVYRKHKPLANSRLHRSAGVKKAYDWGRKLFDIGVTEHYHEASITTEMRHAQYRHFITTGSYKVDDAYADLLGFAHGGIGTPVVVLHPYRHKMVPFMELEDAITFLGE